MPYPIKTEADLSDLLIFRSLLKPIQTQEVAFKPFVGMEVEFHDITSFVHDIIIEHDKIIGVIPIPPGFRSIFYINPVQ